MWVTVHSMNTTQTLNGDTTIICRFLEERDRYTLHILINGYTCKLSLCMFSPPQKKICNMPENALIQNSPQKRTLHAAQHLESSIITISEHEWMRSKASPAFVNRGVEAVIEAQKVCDKMKEPYEAASPALFARMTLFFLVYFFFSSHQSS